MTAITATPSATVPGSWDLTVTGLPTYGPEVGNAHTGWTAGNALTTVSHYSAGQPDDVYVGFDRQGGSGSIAEVLNLQTLADGRRFFLARMVDTLADTGERPLEAAISAKYNGVIEGGTPYVPVGPDRLWLNLLIYGANPELRSTMRPLYPYQRWCGMRVEFFLLDGGNVASVPFGTAWTAQVPIIERTDATGTHPVPLTSTAQQESLITGTLTVTDHGAATTGDLTWTVRYGYYDATTAQTRQTSTTATAPTPAPPPLLSVAGTSDVLALSSVIGIGSSLDPRGTLHHPIGRDWPILVTHSASRSRTGRLSVWCKDYEAARAVEVLLAKEGPHQLRQSTLDGLDMTFTATSVTAGPDSSSHTRWIVEVEYVEVDR